MIEQSGELVDMLVELEGLGIERCAARECEQLLGDLRAAIERVADAFGKLVAAFPVLGAIHQLEPARRGHEQVVEVVRDASGKLAERLHLLRLAQGRFRQLASRDLLEQLAVGRRRRGVRRAEQGDQQRRENQDRADRDVARQARAQRFDQRTQVDGAELEVCLLHRFDHDQVGIPDQRRLPLDVLGPLLPWFGEPGDEMTGRVVEPRGLDVFVHAQRHQVLAGGLVIVEGERPGDAASEDARLDRDLADRVGVLALFPLPAEQQAYQQQEQRDAAGNPAPLEQLSAGSLQEMRFHGATVTATSSSLELSSRW